MKSVWQENSSIPHFPQLKQDIHTDVLIIGGGIAGILTAYFLHKKGVKYTLVEKDSICSKTTANTSAKITFQHGLVYSKILKSYGIETAQKYLSAHKTALEVYGIICKNIDCDFEVKDNYVYSVDKKEKLENEMFALQKIGYKAQFCENIPLPKKTVGAVKFSNQAQFNPLKFLGQISKELNIYENTFVREMIGNTAVTDYAKIFAKKVIVATHF
ncbi:MAG: FAD-binding oxidoreductase, partial [Clostridia bacterium]|nr:FAD-binding oxidoreductase [Clostridia bacterium]